MGGYLPASIITFCRPNQLHYYQSRLVWQGFTWWMSQYSLFELVWRRCIWQGLSIEENICPDASSKFWRFAGFTKYFFKNTIRKLRSIAFQRCILRGGLPLVEVSQNEDFVQKTASKTAFLGDTNLDQVTLSSHNSCSKPPNLKNCYIFGKLSTSAFRLAIGKPAGVNIVRTAGRYFH